MSLSLAQRNAWSLAKTLMVCVTLFKSEAGYGVMPSSEFDGDSTLIVHDYEQLRGSDRRWAHAPIEPLERLRVTAWT